MRLYVATIMKYLVANPIRSRMDIVTLKLNFNGDWVQFIRAWALREPSLVTRYYARPRRLRMLKVVGGYKYLPKRCIRYLRPTEIAKWKPAALKDIAASLVKVVRSGKRRDYQRFSKTARNLRGIGQYSMEHLLRTALLMMNKRHPSPKYVVMGSGASRRKYDIFRLHGITNMAQFNACARAMGYMHPIDAGELAYAMCMIADP